MRRILAISTMSVLVTLTGCSNPVPRVGDPGNLPNYVSLWVANQPMAYSEFTRPHIIKAQMYVEGKKSDANPSHQGAFNSKLGWSESADFAVPEGAKSVRIEATVRTGGKEYTVAEDWRLTEHGWELSSNTVAPRS